jgi:hypothetical protein
MDLENLPRAHIKKKSIIKVVFPDLYPNLSQLTPISMKITITVGFRIDCHVEVGLY